MKDREAWHGAVHGVAESDTTEQLDNIKQGFLWPKANSPRTLPVLPVGTLSTAFDVYFCVGTAQNLQSQ